MEEKVLNYLENEKALLETLLEGNGDETDILISKAIIDTLTKLVETV